MTAMKIAALKDGLSAALRAVRNGERIIVTDRSRAVAVLSAIEDEDGVTLFPPSRSFVAVRKKRWPRTRRRLDSLAALRAERGDR